ncbi:MAG: 50S ribosomal protein L21 [Haliscomenobacter sp.]|jgi:large subunit ribosomal protein L21|nr:50S ribosomal protein L21 [Haliscomenobacter sp.]MBK8652792.1 50S ribosomal protein L21 [Haliscomenobacter sp.]MBP9076207.1 50S ribosomal protein L21 [Haliscomenobacter sp.]MBP9872445.1 50S ribosomal protein L21 [Haliscomenobacter sp.]MBV6429555.1 50S ribosomal protein L21 [Haliscomenobacter sp.]
MFAIVTIAGQQFKVEEGQELFVHQLAAAEGDSVAFDQVLLVENDGKVQIGKPVLPLKVNATVLGHQRGDKVIVFKKKRRKGYRVKNGHRQNFTKIKVDSIA